MKVGLLLNYRKMGVVMKTAKMTGVLQVLANIGIVAGLVMVGLQMQQNEKLLKFQLTNQYYQNYIEMDTALVGDSFYDVYKKAVYEPENMSFADMRVMESQTFAPLSRWISAYRMSKAGLIDADLWKSQIRMDAGFYFGNVYGNAWWAHYRVLFDEGFLPREVKEAIDAELGKSDLNTNLNSYRHIQQLIKEKLENLAAQEGQIDKTKPEN